MWRTGEPSRSQSVRSLLGVAAEEQLLGWLYIGTPVPVRPPPRPEVDARGRAFVLSMDGTVTPLAASLAVR
jgi:hypothetical protein